MLYVANNNSLVYIYGVIYFTLRFQSCWCCQLRQPKSVEDYKKSVDNAVSESTADKTKWVCTLFEEWKQNRLVRSCAFEILPQKTLKKEYKRWTPVITDM